VNRYDSEIAPDPSQWLELDEGERALLVEKHHKELGDKVPNLHLHAMFHVIVENQLALEDQAEVRATLTRLRKEGLSRHDAIHAIGSVLAGHLNELARMKNPPNEPNAKYYAALKRITARSWRGG
jgi:hypothetical protein